MNLQRLHTHDMDRSPLARLSPELRNHIYKYVFQPCRLVYLGEYWRPGPEELQHPLTRTCRQLRAETLAMNMAYTTFYFEKTYDRSALCVWLRAIGPETVVNLRRFGDFISLQRFREMVKEGTISRRKVKFESEMPVHCLRGDLGRTPESMGLSTHVVEFQDLASTARCAVVAEGGVTEHDLRF